MGGGGVQLGRKVYCRFLGECDNNMGRVLFRIVTYLVGAPGEGGNWARRND